MIELDDDRASLSEVESSRREELITRQAVLAERRRTRAVAQRRARLRRNRVLAGAMTIAIGFSLWVALGASGVAAGRHRPAERVASVLRSVLRVDRTVPGRLAAFPWPQKGEGAVAVLGEGVMASSTKESIVPIASLTKMMTAYVVLRDHPLAAGAEGPTFVMSNADVAGWVHASQTDESNVPIVLGEHLSEHQLLEALMIPSADNVADMLAVWDAGSIPAFVAKMNATAESLGLQSTHYADPSGVNPGSRSDASDQAVLAAALMQSPVVRGIVDKPSLIYPVAGTIWNYNPALGTDGIIGVKSGFTSQAQGCLATAAYRTAAGRHVLVVAVALGQAGGLPEAAQVDRGLLDLAGRSLVGYHVPLPSSSVATLDSSAGSTPLYVSGQVPTIIGWPGMKLHLSVEATSSAASASSGAVNANLLVSSSVGVLETVPLSGSLATSTSLVPASTATTATTVASTASSLAASG